MSQEKSIFGSIEAEFKAFYFALRQNIVKVLVNLFIYLLSLITIGLVNFPYIDDARRQIDGDTNFGFFDGRWGSEIFSWFFQGSRHLTDMGLVTPILSAIFLCLASLTIIYVFDDKFSWLAIISSTLFGLNAWFLGCISFRYDSPYMALSLLFSVIPFLWWKSNKITFGIMSFIGVFLMCNTYQLSSGIYIVVLLSLYFQSIIDGEKLLLHFKRILIAAISYILAMICFVIETSFNPEIANRGDAVAISEMTQLPRTFLRNIRAYFITIYQDSSRLWVLLTGLILVAFVITFMKRSKIGRIKAFIWSGIYLLTAAIFSYGVLLIFKFPLAERSVRYGYGLGAFISIVMVMLTSNAKADSKIVKRISGILVLLLTYYSLSFTFVFAANLSSQKDSFERQSMLLASDLKEYVTTDRRVVNMNSLFHDSRVVSNSERNYPILGKLIQSNNAIFWPNTTLFNTYTNLDVTINQFDFKKFDKDDKKLQVKSSLYDIYTSKDQIYVKMK
ncbi:glucosyltransferase domain-containing protein [Lapidilactobacillus wuchangensis]|uniref:glucosyltransferase domain-containing protein n=1 Tax=Lapidilactobacillus wuchangensis TaxID=2486001 RepID=UPI000F776742|nr:glucosyltransferase domain-containing protein [Lapidilactobacillus wuchangensis]